MPQTVRAVSFTGFVDVATAVGLDPYEMLRERAINPLELTDPEARIDAISGVSLLEDAARLSGRDDFSVMMVEYRSFGSLGPLCLLLQHLENPRAVLDAMIKYRALINDLFVLHVDAEEEDILLKVGMLNEVAGFQVVGMTVALLHLILTEVSGGGWSPTSVHFVRPATGTDAAFERFFGVPMQFNSGFDGFACSEQSLGVPNLLADPVRAKQAEFLLGRAGLLRDSPDVVSQTSNAIAELLGTGRATLPNVAALMGMSSRGLQRSLRQARSSFGEVLNTTRSQIAFRYVTDTQLPSSMVAEMVGYASNATFGRWFAGQFGEPPLASRQRRRKATSRAL